MVYDVIAPIYDRMMFHVEYEAWADLVERIAGRYRMGAAPTILEIGGGTGILAAKMLARGYPYICTDRSFGMCQVAREHNPKAPLLCVDAKALPFKRGFDIILFLYDGINYLQTVEEYAALFAEAYRCLAPDGLFLFDITTEANSLHHFQSYLDFEDMGDVAYVRRSYYKKETCTQHNDFTLFRRLEGDPPRYAKETEHHSQKVLGATTIARAVPSRLFTIEGMWDGFTFKNWRPHSERIHFLLQKR
jgi:SAM-dependent methyltransferase